VSRKARKSKGKPRSARKAPAPRRKAAARGRKPPRGTTPAVASLSLSTFERLLTEARRRTGAEAGTVYLRDEEGLRFAIVQNDLLERRVGRAAFQQRLRGERLPLDRVSIASWVALTRGTVNLPVAQDTPLDRPYAVDRRIDRRLEYVTRSVLATPLRDASGTVIGVLQLINALDRRGRVVSFDRSDELALSAIVDAALGHTAVGV
jgi:GAF domain-containing protein